MAGPRFYGNHLHGIEGPYRLSHSDKERKPSLRGSLSLSIPKGSESFSEIYNSPKRKSSQSRFLTWVSYNRKFALPADDTRRRQCPLINCEKEFEEEDNMLKHVYTCPRLSDGLYRCYRCGNEEKIGRYHQGHQCETKECLDFFAAVGNSLRFKKRNFSLSPRDRHPDRQPDIHSDVHSEIPQHDPYMGAPRETMSDGRFDNKMASIDQELPPEMDSSHEISEMKGSDPLMELDCPNQTGCTSDYACCHSSTMGCQDRSTSKTFDGYYSPQARIPVELYADTNFNTAPSSDWQLSEFPFESSQISAPGKDYAFGHMTNLLEVPVNGNQAQTSQALSATCTGNAVSDQISRGKPQQVVDTQSTSNVIHPIEINSASSSNTNMWSNHSGNSPGTRATSFSSVASLPVHSAGGLHQHSHSSSTISSSPYNNFPSRTFAGSGACIPEEGFPWSNYQDIGFGSACNRDSNPQWSNQALWRPLSIQTDAPQSDTVSPLVSPYTVSLLSSTQTDMQLNHTTSPLVSPCTKLAPTLQRRRRVTPRPLRRMSRTPSEIKHKCVGCGSSPSGKLHNRASNLKRHQSTCTKYQQLVAPGSVIVRHKCRFPNCHKSFSRADNLRAHQDKQRHRTACITDQLDAPLDDPLPDFTASVDTSGLAYQTSIPRQVEQRWGSDGTDWF